jgi:hypothetical protein
MRSKKPAETPPEGCNSTVFFWAATLHPLCFAASLSFDPSPSALPSVSTIAFNMFEEIDPVVEAA